MVDSIVGGALRVQDGDDAAICERLFKGLVFFLGREVPREQLLFVIRAFGGVVAWQGEGSPLPESNDSITHQVSLALSPYSSMAFAHVAAAASACMYLFTLPKHCLSRQLWAEMDAKPARVGQVLPVCLQRR